MKSIFEAEAYNEVKSRLDHLKENATRNWGKMSTGQMVHHCQTPINVILEKKDYGLKPNLFVKLLFKKSMYNDKPWRKNMPTPPMFKEKEERNFKAEKENLSLLIDELYAQKNREEWQPHPAFGKFTKDQYGKMHYKHLDHHLTQFGV